MPSAPRIDGERLYLRGLCADDVGGHYVEWLNDPVVNRFLETRFVAQTASTVREFVEGKERSTTEYLMGIFERSGDRHVGNIKLGPIRVHHGLAEVSLFLGERGVWGLGYAGEAIRLLTSFAFESLQLRKLTASMYEENVGSTRAFLKAGWLREGYFPNHYVLGGKPTGLVVVGLNRSVWQAN